MPQPRVPNRQQHVVPFPAGAEGAGDSRLSVAPSTSLRS